MHFVVFVLLLVLGRFFVCAMREIQMLTFEFNF